MGTKLIASTRRTHRAVGSGPKMAVWVGSIFGMLLIAAVLVAGRIGMPLAGLGLSESIHARLTIGAKDQQPVVGRSVTVMGLVYDGTRYTHAPVQVGATGAGRGYTVTALVYDGTRYGSAPVQVGGR